MERNLLEKVLYTMMVISGLEVIRSHHNEIENEGRKANLTKDEIGAKESAFVFRWALCLGLIVLFLMLRVVILPLIEQIVGIIKDMEFLQSSIAFYTITAMTYLFSIVVSFNLLRAYITRVNAAKDFFKNLGRSWWDGSKGIANKAGEVTVDVFKSGKRTIDAVPGAGLSLLKGLGNLFSKKIKKKQNNLTSSAGEG